MTARQRFPLATMTGAGLPILYDLMDSAYDAPESEPTARRWGTLQSSTLTPAVLRASGSWLRRQRPSAALATSPASRCATVSAQPWSASTVVSRACPELDSGTTLAVVRYACVVTPRFLCHLMFGILALTVAQLVRLLA